MPLLRAGRYATFQDARRHVTIPHTRTISRLSAITSRWPRFCNALPMMKLPACWNGCIQQRRVRGHRMSPPPCATPGGTTHRPEDHDQGFASLRQNRRRRRHHGGPYRSAKPRDCSSALARARRTGATPDARPAANGLAAKAARASPGHCNAWTGAHQLTSIRRRTEHFSAILRPRAATAVAMAGISTWPSPDSGSVQMRIQLLHPSNGTAPDTLGSRCGSALTAPISTSRRPARRAGRRSPSCGSKPLRTWTTGRRPPRAAVHRRPWAGDGTSEDVSSTFKSLGR